ncbi:hypothetical protein BKG77_17635 [Mycobacteroides chelonae]|uniref:hypothetical protein n=1 Tax=Mycobacteroides chelonae TaxID=1774 RepID=UPI0008AA53FB|nr:hypothetical protein [Mycobacteroides chelonae]OHU25178.1 hypothetical protein BKG77_17635 [Mycobacteroides chelonae]OHU46861.1 hypothetical protein BKG78_00525 [Mycobacteroides chelonae]OHU63328.1 hypothetical protein BKG85_18250 [Mycobacteroides chelonae]
MRTICSVVAGVGVAAVLVSVFAAPAASAVPGEGPVAVQCQVYANNNFGPPGFGPGSMPGMGFGMKQWAGAVIGHGSNEPEARQDAERQMWGPYGMAPELRDCVPAA